MRKFIYDSWNGVMNHDKNPLKHIPDLNVRHMVLQIFAWMVYRIFDVWWKLVCNGISMVAHVLILRAIVVTVGTFNTAKNPNWTYRTPSRCNVPQW